MPNSDNKFGVYNKITMIYERVWPDNSESADTKQFEVAWKEGAEGIAEAKAWHFTDAGLAVFDECCTELQWGLVEDADGWPMKLKATMTFGTKGTPGIAAADDWAEQFKSRKTALINANNFFKNGTTATNVTESSEHLF
tara:strand:+ start:346 stop:762 length:417 start_codon:yes stop_codon:yes gene_type:complete